ncbi:MAG: protein jag [Anaerotruncus sp.]|nr:protein jag [Anaerotruncus sp.]
MREIIKEARSVEEAIDLACKELGVERDAIDFEIINLPKRGFFGFRNTPAKVRVTLPEPEPVVEPVKKPEPPKKKVVEQKIEKPVEPPKPQPRSSEKKDKPQPPKAEAAAPKEPVRKEQKEQPELVFVGLEELQGKARTAGEYIKGILTEMGITSDIAAAQTENGIILRLSGEGLGVIIGRRGETLDSLQYLTGLVANREEGDYMRVTIDSGNYRQKRERTLEQLAQKLSNAAIRYGRPSTLEPMNPYERRIIHSTVSKIEGVSSSSIGEEPNRRVVITPDVLKPQNGGGQRGRRSRGGKNRGKGGRTEERRESRQEFRTGTEGHSQRRERPVRERPETVKPTPTTVDKEYMKEIERVEPAVQKPAGNPVRTQARKEGDDLPLYGKIEL